MRKSRISFNISKKRGKNEGGESNMADPSPTGSQQSTLKLSSYYACRFCCKRFKSELSYETHSKTKKHGKAVKAGTEFELKKSRTCAGCKQDFETRLQLTQHCKKNSHMPLVQKTSLKNPVYGKPYTEAEQEDPFVSIKYYSPYYCELCDLDCVNVQHYEDHTKGERHEKAVEKRAEQGKGVLVDLDTNEVDTSNDYLVIMNKVEPVTERVSAYYCGICDTDCRSEIAYTEHVTSKDHQVRMEGHGQLKISCDLCCMTFNSENNHKMHLKSKKHANNLAARQRLLPLETDPEKESVQDLRDKIKRTISPPLENFDKIKVNIAGDSADDANTRSVVVDIQADEEDAMEMGKPRVTLDKKEKKELERKLKEDEEERGKWAKRREEEYGKKRAEILKVSKWDPKVSPTETKGRGRGQPTDTRGRGRGKGQVAFNDKYKWVAPGLKNQGEKSDSNTPRERYSKDDKDRYSKDESGGRYSKEGSKERYSKDWSKDHGSRERYPRDDSKSDKRDKRDSKSDRRRKTYDDDKYTSDSDDERVILKKGERKTMDDDNDDLRKVINKQRGIVEKDDGKSLVFDYGHQSVENASDERAKLKGFFGGAFAHLREDGGPSEDGKEVDNYSGGKMEEIKEPEKDAGKDMERTLLLELLKRQFPDIRYLTERQGGLELMQKIFGAQGMSGLAGLDLEGTGSVASARSIASDEGSVKSQPFKQEGNLVSLVPEEVAPAEEKKVEAKSASPEKRESRRDRRSRSRSKSRERRRRSRSDSRSRSGRKKNRYSSRKRSRSSSQDRYSKRSRRTPSPDKRKKDERVDKSSDEKDKSKNSEKDKKENLVSQAKAKSKDAKDKALAKWTVSNWSGGNEEGGKDSGERGERKKASEKESKRSDRKEDKRHKEKEGTKAGTKEDDSRKAKRKEEPKTDREEDKKRQRTNSEGDKIFEDASDYEDIDLETKVDLKEQFENDYEKGGEQRRSEVEDKRRPDGEEKRRPDSSSRKARGGQGNSKSTEELEGRTDQKRRETEGRGDEKRRDSEGRDEKRRKKSYDRYNYEDRFNNDCEDEMDELQKDLLANLARVENLGRVLPPVGPPFPMGGGPFMPPLSGPPLSGPPISVPPPPLGLLPPVGGPYPPQPGLGPVMLPAPPDLGHPTIPVNPNSALTYIQPTEEHNPFSRASSSTDRALKSLLSQVSALGAGGKTISTSSILRPIISARSESPKPSSELHRLGEVYSDDFEASDDEDDSGSKPLKSILKKKSKFSVRQGSEQPSSGLPKNAVGAEYVVSTGEQAKYFCQLCDVQFATLSAKNLHLRGPKHLAMFMKHKSPLIDEMIKQAMGVVVGNREKKNEAEEDSDEEKEIKSEMAKNIKEPRDSSHSPLPKRSPSPEPMKERLEKERSISPYDSREPRLFVDERTGRIVQAGGYYSEGKAGRSEGSRVSRQDPQASREDTQVPREDQSTSSKSSESGPSGKLELGAVPTPDEYDRLSQRAKDVLSREEYAQLPPSTRKLLLLETSDQSAAKEQGQTGRAKESDGISGSIPRDQPLTTREYQKLDDVKSTEQAPPASTIKDYEDLSPRARSLLTREEYERLPTRDKEYLSREEYLTREDYDKQTAREAAPLSRDEYEAVARERERLTARDMVSRESYERLDRERLADLDRLVDRDRLPLADRDRLALTERERLALADRDRLGLADRDRLGLADRDRLSLAERDRLALADRDRLAALADRDRLIERDRLTQRDYYDRYPPRDELPYRPGADDYARERGRPMAREEYSKYIGPLDDDLAQRRDDYAKQRTREDHDRPLPREGYREPDYRRDPRDVPPGRDPRDERPPPGRDYRDLERSRETYGDPRSRDIRVVSDRGGPSGYDERRMSPPRDWPRGAESKGPDPREAPISGGETTRAPEGDRRPDETAQKEGDNAERLGTYEARPDADRREVTDTHTYRDDESDQRYHGRETGPDQYDAHGYDSARRGGPGGSRGHRGRGGGNRGGQRGHPRNAGYNRGQSRRGGQGRY